MRVNVVLAGLAVVLASASLAFAVSPADTATAQPVAFSDTLTTGMTGVDIRQADVGGYEIPRAEVFYSQYQYIVGYYGIEAALGALDRDATTQQFGHPLAIYVTDFADAGVDLTDDGLLTVTSDPEVDWVEAGEAFFVVDSAARTPGGPAIVPFDDRASAARFADRYGGTVRRWDELDARETGSTGERVRTQVEQRGAWADRAVKKREDLLDRPVSATVGENVSTLAAAVRTAEENSTIRLPPGTYHANLTSEKSVTIRGAGDRTRLVGDGTGTVLTLRGERTALSNLSIAGVGTNNTGEPSNASVANGSWDETVRTVYGYGDAAVVLDGAKRSLLSDVTIETPASGAIVRESDGTVIRDAEVDGTDTWQDGFMGVLAMNSRIVIQNSTFTGGRDAVYTHDADGLVVRNNRMRGMRFGVHEMFTSRTVVANNTVAGTNIGIVVMTRPKSNAVVGNRVSDSGVGISMSGSSSAVLGNVVTGNRYGMDLGSQRSTYEHNLVYGNDVGLRTGTIVPTNEVTDNDIIENDRYVTTGRGPVRVWSGNYWGAIPGRDRDGDGTIERSFRPTGIVDSAVSRSAGAATLARSPAVVMLRQFETAVPGLRAADVIDDRPRAESAQSGLSPSNATVGDGGVSP
ncbi:NosD domain-containing protein [Halorhabdus amylolytica]|uniref:NosD domain-containing protein n=1 Tax=Halorhabdus amylolytica TaxID=2559573 RepID=UPI0010AA18F1|nr:NosD domain-containing protein [Halorhabdus amylolytica]